MSNQRITDYYKVKRQRTGQVSENDKQTGQIQQQTLDGSKSTPRPSTSQASPQTSPRENANENLKSSPQQQRVLRGRTVNLQNRNLQNRDLQNRNLPNHNLLKSAKSTVNAPRDRSTSQHAARPAAAHQPSNAPNPRTGQQAKSRPTTDSSGVFLMRKVFQQAQFTQQSDACIRALHRFIDEFEFHVFYEEFCRNTKCTLQFEHANPGVKNMLATISAFLLSAKKKYSTENLKRRLEMDKSVGRPKQSRSALDSFINDEENNEGQSDEEENDENRDVSNRPIAAENSSNVSTDEIILMMNESANLTSAPKRLPAKFKIRNSPKSSKTKSSAVAPSNDDSSNAEDDQLHKLYRLFRNLLDFVISDVLLPFLCSVNVNTRLNAACLLLKLVNSIEDLDASLFGRLKASLLERLIDKSPKVRALAAVLLYRFQDHQTANDAVQWGLVFHLKHDPSQSVRLACLNVLVVNKETLPAILSKTRDASDRIRAKAFAKLAKKIDFKALLNKEQRLFLIRNGLNDRSQSVQTAFARLVIPAWIRSYADNLVDLLMDLDLIEENAASGQTNCELIERFLANYFESALSASRSSSLCKLHLIIVDFAKYNLDDEFLVKSERFTAETFFLWCALIKFFRGREDALDQVVDIAEQRIKLKKEFVQLLQIETSVSIGHSKGAGNEVGDQAGNVADNVAGDEMSETNEVKTGEVSAKSSSPNHSPLEQSVIDENNNETSEVLPDQAAVNQNTSPTAEGRNLQQDHQQDPTQNEIPQNENPQNANSQNESFNLAELVNEQQEAEDFDLLGLVMPRFSMFIRFLRSFCEHLNLNVDEKSDELPGYRFMFKQLISFLDNYETADGSQKAVIDELVEELFELNENTVKVRGYTELIMNFAYRNAHHKNKKQFFEYSMELLQRLEMKINLEEERRNNEKISEKEIRDLQVLNATKTVRIHELKDQLDEALEGDRFDRAHELQREIELLKQECNRLAKEIDRMKNVLEYQEHREAAAKDGGQQSGDQFDISHYPIEHIKLLQIFGVALRNGLNNIHSLVNYGIDRYILPGIISTDPHVRLNALMALNEACCLNLKLACRFCPLYFEICQNDNNQIQNCALQGLIDQLVEHGAELFYGGLEMKKEASNLEERNQATANESKQSQEIPSETDQQMSSKSDQSDQSNQSDQQKTVRTPMLLFGSRFHSDNSSIASNKDEPLINKSQFIELNAAAAAASRSSADPLTREQVIQDFVRFLLSQTRAADESLKASSVMGICKLMLLGRIYSPKLLSELILLWFNASTSQAIQQDIGTFLPIYCLEQSSLAVTVGLPPHLTGQHSLLECFMVTVENVYRLERGQQLNSSFLNAERSNYYSDIDALNVIDFMLNLLEPINHPAIAIEFGERILDILQIEREDEYMLDESFATKYLIRGLHSFALNETGEEARQRLVELLQAIRDENRYGELRKASVTRIEKFMRQLS